MEIANDRKKYLDCARAVCMLYIVGFWHLFDYTGKSIVNPLTSQITYGVLATFTFISSFFLGRKKITDMKSVLSFWGKRLIHFYPLFGSVLYIVTNDRVYLGYKVVGVINCRIVLYRAACAFYGMVFVYVDPLLFRHTDH